MDLLSWNQSKMLKSEGLGYLSGVLHLQPAIDLGGGNTCPWSTVSCRKTCLAQSGRFSMELAKTGVRGTAKYRRTKLLYSNYVGFFEQLVREIRAGQRRAQKLGLSLTIRLNGTSDLTWEDMFIPNTSGNIFQLFPDIQFIDYTKGYARLFKQLPSNYHLTYSLNEDSPPNAVGEILTSTRHNVTQVYTKERYAEVLAKGFDVWAGYTAPVVTGDESDLRHLDPRGHVVALKYKVARNSRMKAIKPTIGSFIRG